MNFFNKNKQNLLVSSNLNIEGTCKNFSELSVEEIASIKKIKLENFKNSEIKNSVLIASGNRIWKITCGEYSAKNIEISKNHDLKNSALIA